MSITEYERNHLFTWFEEHMGKERASTMMSLLPPAGWADVAMKRDLDNLEARLDAKIDSLEARLDAKIDHLAIATSAHLHQFRSDVQRTFVTWMFAAQGATVAAIGLLIAFTR